MENIYCLAYYWQKLINSYQLQWNLPQITNGKDPPLLENWKHLPCSIKKFVQVFCSLLFLWVQTEVLQEEKRSIHHYCGLKQDNWEYFIPDAMQGKEHFSFHYFKTWTRSSTHHQSLPSSLLDSLNHQRAASRSKKNYNPAACGPKTTFTER